MATIAIGTRDDATPAAALAEPSRYIWLVTGAGTSLFAVGGRWDLPLAAWLFSVFLLRFSRTSRPAVGLGLVWLVSISAALFWVWQLGIPTPLMTVVGCVAYGTMFTVPYLLDRLLIGRLGPAAQLFLFPASLAACEFVMGVFSPFGTAYGLLAVTQHANLPLLQVISVTGPYAIGFLIGWFATVVNRVWEGPLSWRRVRTVVGVFAAALTVILVGGGVRLAFFPPSPSYVRVAGVTPSMAVLDTANKMLGFKLLGASSPTRKEDLDRLEPTKLRPAYDLVQEELFANTRLAAQAGAKLVVWSENAAAVRAEDEPALLAKAAAVARAEHIYLNVAANVPMVRDRTHLIGPSGDLLWTYDKAHPIPGMEFYAPGVAKAAVVRTPFGEVANVICYDADFPAMMRANADIMLVPGGDWPEMGRVHTLGMASLRAIENGYTLFRQDFNGLSAVFDSQGRVIATQDTTTSDQHVMIVDIPNHGSPTIYRRVGDIFAWLCVTGAMLLIGMGLTRRRPVIERSSPRLSGHSTS